ncbi:MULTISPECIES: DEAD/DEAH box helicase [Reichenbachiella]|uniref:DEAD/DEAH box helicase n=1 Tax=Reichenbachiella TaxID=156993 RepID=UPI000E6BB639|nr:DEAD/DEAH box helicase [Reichenbachiella sp. MSK19-1]MBU2916085.1 DEAD/DEAH box helicase [Reichenbachiella agariperforans]RJE72120.1 DEAD/DEAH box helicase [Reichenbachiella sp. MSK19-1]
MATFLELGVSKDLVKGLKELDIITPSEIQEATIPALISAPMDFIGQAQTGTGKTAAFGLPLLSNIDPKNDKVQALILSPTRELCQQIAKQLFKFTKYTDKVFIESVYGGAKIDEQISRLRRPTQIVVATPGRLVDLIGKGAINLSQVQTVVLDEADEMLSMGFKKELNQILDVTAGERNIWLFSATMSPDVKKIISTYLSQKAMKVEFKKKSLVNESIEHNYVVTEVPQKLQVLLSFLNSQQANRGLIFCNTKAVAQTLSKQLLAKNIQTAALEGDMKQKERDKVLRAFKNEAVQVLVATDVAARGIDVKDLAYVVHYQVPQDLEYFIHRAGRTGRAGKKGLSLCIIEEKEQKTIRFLEKELKIKMQRIKD